MECVELESAIVKMYPKGQTEGVSYRGPPRYATYLMVFLIVASVLATVIGLGFLLVSVGDYLIHRTDIVLASMPFVGLAKAVRKNDVQDACAVVKEIFSVLNNPRRERILKILTPGKSMTFEQLKVESEISTGSLHHHLKILENAGFVAETDERPKKFYRTNLLGFVTTLMKDSNNTENFPARISEEAAAES